eukprot:c18979_g1_i1.p1 GENE.c18979_g1_i1~~c18979_g1_i1.p1  ORF type:complete len:245 (-),score=70.64 c18979_g1_i1:15-749(-)
MSVDLETEKVIAFNVLKRLFQERFAFSLFHELYPTHGSEFQTSNFVNNSSLVPFSLSPKPPKLELTMKVEEFSLSHYAGIAFPKFEISITRSNNSRIINRYSSNQYDTFSSLREDIPDIEIKLSVWNKWADVSDDVLPNHNRIKLIQNGNLEVSDFVINGVSIKHGGFFILRIDPISTNSDFSLNSWHSGQITVNSTRTLSKRRKIKRDSPCPPVQSIFSFQNYQSSTKNSNQFNHHEDMITNK